MEEQTVPTSCYANQRRWNDGDDGCTSLKKRKKKSATSGQYCVIATHMSPQMALDFNPSLKSRSYNIFVSGCFSFKLIYPPTGQSKVNNIHCATQSRKVRDIIPLVNDRHFGAFFYVFVIMKCVVQHSEYEIQAF